jgi:hypothetical protein
MKRILYVLLMVTTAAIATAAQQPSYKDRLAAAQRAKPDDCWQNIKGGFVVSIYKRSRAINPQIYFFDSRTNTTRARGEIYFARYYMPVKCEAKRKQVQQHRRVGRPCGYYTIYKQRLRKHMRVGRPCGHSTRVVDRRRVVHAHAQQPQQSKPEPPKPKASPPSPVIYSLSPEASQLFLELEKAKRQLEAQQLALMIGAKIPPNERDRLWQAKDGIVEFLPKH